MNEQKHPFDAWKEELKDAPTLRNLKRVSIFQPPAGYFDQLTDQIQQKLEKSAKEVDASLLDQLSKDNVFRVPPLYFEELPHRLHQVVDHIPVKPRSTSFRKLRPGFTLAIAASISLLLIIGLWMRPSSDASLQLKDIPVEELMAELEWEQIPTETLVEVIGEEKAIFEEEEADAEGLEDLLLEINDSDLEDMLIDM